MIYTISQRGRKCAVLDEYGEEVFTFAYFESAASLVANRAMILEDQRSIADSLSDCR